MHFIVFISGGIIAFVGQLRWAEQGVHFLHFSLSMYGGIVVVICPCFWSTGTTIRGISPFPDCAAMFVISVSAIACTIFAVVFAVVGLIIIISYLLCVSFPDKG